MAFDSFFEIESNKQVPQKSPIKSKVAYDQIYGELENISLVQSEEE